jgi:hypothetical protein
MHGHGQASKKPSHVQFGQQEYNLLVERYIFRARKPDKGMKPKSRTVYTRVYRKRGDFANPNGHAIVIKYDSF